MATTSIWKFNSSLKKLLNYVTNEEKTNNKEFVSGVNCLPNIAYQEMMNTKKQLFKTDGIECFHGYQSFVSGEVTPEVAHEIGVKLAEELWGDKYQVIICTHINKQNIHNHIIINSVKKYSDFKLVIKAKGYENIKDGGKYLTMKTPYFSRNIRIDRFFGDKYSVKGIKERIYGYSKEELPPAANFKKKYYRKIYTGPKTNKFLLQTSSLYRLYAHYLYAFKILPAKNEYREMTPEYYKQKRKNNIIFEEINFLARHKFESIKEVESYKIDLECKLPNLKGKREDLWRKYHKATKHNDKNIIKKEINELTENIDIIYAQKNACDRIIDRYPIIKEEYKNEIESKNKAVELIKEDRVKYFEFLRNNDSNGLAEWLKELSTREEERMKRFEYKE